MFSFTEKFLNVSLRAEPNLVKEGIGQLTMTYNMKQGVVEQQMWFFNDKAINTNSHYLIANQSLVINKPNRNDTGRYRVSLTNPFSTVTTSILVTVLCKINDFNWMGDVFLKLLSLFVSPHTVFAVISL